MIVGVLSGIVTAGLLAVMSLLWGHRHHLAILRATLYPRGQVRVSFAALLRVKDDDRYVLVGSASRPGFYGPPGGVFKYRGTAEAALDEVGFVEERPESQRHHMRADLRGYVPAGSLRGFVDWFTRGDDRETATECLRRELDEELGSELDATLRACIESLTFVPVRSVMEGPRRSRPRSIRQLRRLEIYDIAVVDEAAARFRRRLIELGDDPSMPSLVCASNGEITTGWSRGSPVNSHAAYLLGRKKVLPDLPPLPLLATLVAA
jgi:8-oxo-dGTP pyrophosphatase MutT (NUDIX family)